MNILEMLLQKSKDFGEKDQDIMDLSLWLNIKLQIRSPIDIWEIVR